MMMADPCRDIEYTFICSVVDIIVVFYMGNWDCTETQCYSVHYEENKKHTNKMYLQNFSQVYTLGQISSTFKQ